jgi:TRAP transporter TAXI family solute receptor
MLCLTLARSNLNFRGEKMKSFIAIAALGLITTAQAASVGIASGNPTGTNYPMVEDIKRVCSTPASPITNVASDGSLANIDKIYSDSNTQYGIIQADALEYQKGIDPKMMSRIVMVFPFFSTEFHLVGKYGTKINSLADLAGKRVVEGPQGSGTWVTVQVIKALTGIKWTPILASQADGFNMVMSGQAEAEFIVAGKPVSMLATSKGYKLIPLSNPALDSFGLYTKTMISAGTYDAVQDTVQTYKVDNVLATYAFTNQYQREIGDLVSCITKNIGTLQTTGHPKWRDVDPLDIDRIKWPSHPAAVAAIKRESKKK